MSKHFTKKSLILSATLMALTLTAVPSHAQTVVNAHVHNKTTAAITTAKAANRAKDGAKVSLKGTIVKPLGNERYQFKDNTGRIVVDIDDDLWQERVLDDATTVEIFGEVDVDYKHGKRLVEIDVQRIIF